MIIKKLFLIMCIGFLTACSASTDDKEIEPLPPSLNAPVLDSIDSQVVEEGASLSFIVSARSTDGSIVDYRLDNPPEGSSVDQKSGLFTWTPNESQSGSYSFVFRAFSSGGVDSMIVEVNVTDKSSGSPIASNIITLDNTNFTEGEVKEKLFRLSINSSKIISYIDVANFNKAFTVIDNMNGEAVAVNALNTSSRIDFTNNPSAQNYFTELKGVVKQAGIYNLQFNIVYSDATTDAQSVQVVINSSLKPIFRYNLINTFADGALAVPISKVYNQVNITYDVLKGSLTPILDGYIEKNIYCNSAILESFLFETGDTNGHQACVESEVSSTSETVILFSRVETSSRVVGGLSLGTRKGALVSRSSFNHTLIHELGHNLGLAHTHETYAALNFHHSSQNNGAYDGGFFRRLVYSYNTFRPLQYGDGIHDTPIDPFGSYYVSPLMGGGGFFTAFNGVLEGEAHLLYKGSQPVSAIFNDSEYMCKQVYNEGVYNFACDNYSYIFDDAIINNVMSYWYKIPGEEHLTPGQISKMVSVINNYPAIQ